MGSRQVAIDEEEQVGDWQRAASVIVYFLNIALRAIVAWVVVLVSLQPPASSTLSA
jgi:hypothetical protein